MPKLPKRPRDPNQFAKLIVDIATGKGANDSPKPDQGPENGMAAQGRAEGR